MAFVDYYKILGVDKNIPQKDVRAAYRKRAKQFHPDLHPNDPKAKAKFQALNEAYEVISDPDKRAKYDQYGEQWKNADAFGGFGGAGGAGGSGSYGGAGGNPFEGFDFSQFGGGGGFSSFFENLFGGRGRSQQSAEGFGSGNFGGFNGQLKVQSQSCINMLHFMYLWLPMIINILVALLLTQLNVEKANEKLRIQKEIGITK